MGVISLQHAQNMDLTVSQKKKRLPAFFFFFFLSAIVEAITPLRKPAETSRNH